MDSVLSCITIIAFVTISLIHLTHGCQPIIRIYEENNNGEQLSELFFAVDEVDLFLKGINHTNAKVFTCPEGVFMGYEQKDFEGESTIVAGPMGGVYDHCKENDGGHAFRSLKVVGSPEDFTANSFITYIDNSNEGNDTTYLEDAQQLNNTRFNSLIITGNLEVELFTEGSYQGNSFCIRPNNGIIRTEEEFNAINDRLNGTELYTDLMDLIAIFNRNEFNSMKFGCGEGQLIG